MRVPADPVARGWLFAAAVLTSVVAVVVIRDVSQTEIAEPRTKGIDVSHHQGEIDWEKVAGDSVNFAYIKASEGTGFKDERYAENFRAARQAGVTAGPYHFFTLCSDGREQGEWFVDVAPPTDGALRPAVDLEFSRFCDKRPSKLEFRTNLEEFLDVVESAWGHEALLYVHDRFEKKYPTRDLNRPRWRVNLNQRPKGEWDLWQKSHTGKVAGIKGPVDLNVVPEP